MPARPRKTSPAAGLARQVAQRAGVSLMTVSRVFNDSPRVSPDTRERVLAVAEEVGYQPNIAARALRNGRPMMIGFMAASHEHINGSYHAQTLVALESVFAPAGYTLAIMIPRGGETMAAMIRRLVASRACATVVLRLDKFEGLGLEGLADLEAPILFAGGASPAYRKMPPFSAVRFDNQNGIVQAVRHLHALGHQRIAYLGGTPGWLDSEERLAGFRHAMQELNLPVQESWVRACSFALAYDTGREAVSAVLASGGAPPTAFVCASDEIAAGAYAGAARWGKRIPEDFSVVGFDDNQWCEFVNPSLTTVRHSGFDLGVRVGQLALKLVEQSRLSVHDEVLDTSLVVRGSTAPPPSRK